tara:strand:- start:11807 stop:13327 length:1521 start_codon:yes stop_codon:yes gene_type:complete
MKSIFFLVIYFQLVWSNLDGHSCIASIGDRDISRNDYTYPESIESEHFKIHFTISDVDSQFVNNQWMSLQSNLTYAQSIIDLLEFSMEKYMHDGWISPPPDCDESIVDLEHPSHCVNFGGNALYDIYISNDGVGMVVPENPHQIPPYTGGYTSYMKISTMLNQYDIYPSWAYYVIAHELHHSIQLRYGSSTSGEIGNYSYNLWFFEQSATYMENVVFPNSNHLLAMLSNCNVVTPLTYPEHGINYPAEIFPYRSALWQKYLVKAYEDSSIARIMWENYGLEYASGDGVSLFPIYNEAIYEVTNGNVMLSDAFNDYALWRYFTGERSIGLDYFNQAGSYCESKVSDLENSLYSFYSNTGGAYYFNIDNDINDLKITSAAFDQLSVSLLLIDSDENITISDLSLMNESTIFFFDEYSDYNKILIINTNYLEALTEVITFDITLNNSFELGDINSDAFINVNDVVSLINYILLYDEFDDEILILADMNFDLELNIMDVVILVDIILTNN